jgi:hypothetical protein
MTNSEKRRKARVSGGKQDYPANNADNIVSFLTKVEKGAASFSLADVEAFCIDTEEVYYISVIYKDRRGYYHSHGHAVFSTGEKMKFTIAVNDDETVRDRCYGAGQRIAEQFGATLMTGTIDECGKFYRNANVQKEEEVKCGKN